MPRIRNLPRRPEITWISWNPELFGSSGRRAPNVLGINPWIYDFAAYNLWSRPLGLISCLEALCTGGCNVALLDCMHPTWRDIKWPKPDRYGCGRYPRTELPRPEGLSHVPRRFCRYGLPLKAVSQALQNLDPPPDLILISSPMTYWYPGAIAASRLARSILPRTPQALGGIYPTLCPEHARKTAPVELLAEGPVEGEPNWSRLWELIGSPAPPAPDPRPGALLPQLYPGADFSVLLGSRGCPFSCHYCSSGLLYPGFRQFSRQLLQNQVEQEKARGIRDFAFYDDALLVRPRTWLEPLLESLSAQPRQLRLHTPNGLHAAYLTPQICRLLYRGGLTTVRLGLETSSFGSRPDDKLTRQEWDYGVRNLFQAGFRAENVAAYILFGLPGQSEEEVTRAVAFAKSYGVRPQLAYYSPIPGTRMFSQALRHSPYPLQEEPLYHNPAIWPCYPGGFTWSERSRWREILQGDQGAQSGLS